MVMVAQFYKFTKKILICIFTMVHFMVSKLYPNRLFKKKGNTWGKGPFLYCSLGHPKRLVQFMAYSRHSSLF